MATAYDPGAVELPSIRLLGVDHQLAEVTKTRAGLVGELQKRIGELVDQGEAWDAHHQNGEPMPERSEAEIEEGIMRCQCDLLAVSVKHDGDLGERLFAAYQADELSIQFLTRASAWVQRAMAEDAELGEG